MQKLRLALIICILVGLFIPFRYAYPEEAGTSNLSALIQEALDNNPQIQVAYNNWKAAEYKITNVKGLPDPTARYTYFGKNIETRVGPQEHKYGLSQKLPFPGKLDLKAKAQLKEAAKLKERYEAIRREIIKDIKLIYYDLYWVDKSIQVTQEEKTILESLEKVIQRKYESNLSPQQDVIKIQVELSKLIDKLFVLEQNQKSLEAKMNSLLNRPKGSKLKEIEEVKPSELEHGLEDLITIAQQASQDLSAANLDIEKAEYEKRSAKLDYLPDFTFGIDYIQVGSGHTSSYNDGQDAWMGTVAVNIPIWFDKLGAQFREKKAILEARKKNYQNVENNITYQIEDLYFKINTYKEIISLYENALIPQARQSFEAVQTGYEADRVDFLDWLDAERTLLQTRLAYYKAIVDYKKAVAYLEKVIGKDL